MVRAALSGELAEVESELEPFFGLRIPKSCPGVPSSILQPKGTWIDKTAYDAKAKEVAANFKENFKEFSSKVDKEIIKADPTIFS
jgi:phosphoenolpyruvate carboxykinase (ATP)